MSNINYNMENNYIKLQFNDNSIILLSKTSIIYRYSSFLQTYDTIVDDNDNIMYIICDSITDACDYFSNAQDLMFIFKLPIYYFLKVCEFLNIINYDNEYDEPFKKQFIIYVMDNINDLKHELTKIHAFMNREIRSIMNYINNIDVDIQIRVCTPIFYNLYLIKYKEEVLKNNRNDIFDYITNNRTIMIPAFFKFTHKYDNRITEEIKRLNTYKEYIQDISRKLLNIAYMHGTLNEISKLIDEGADINYQGETGHSVLYQYCRRYCDMETIKYLVEHGAEINYTRHNTFHNIVQNDTVLSCKMDFNMFKYFVDNGADINISGVLWIIIYYNQLKHLRYIVEQYNFSFQNKQICNISKDTKLKIIKYAIEHGADINAQNNTGNILHNLCNFSNKTTCKIIKYIIDIGINVNIQNIHGCTALYYAIQQRNNLDIIKYLIEHGADITINNNIHVNGYYIYHMVVNNINAIINNIYLTNALVVKNNTDVIEYLNSFYKYDLQQLLNNNIVHNDKNVVDNLLQLGCVLQRV